MADIIHGYKTVFPVPIGLASSFEPRTSPSDTARVSAVEAATSGIHVTFSPMADLVRDPRWGRIVESFGEDPVLISQYGRSDGERATSTTGSRKLATSPPASSTSPPTARRRPAATTTPSDVSRLSLHQFYLPGYKAAHRGRRADDHDLVQHRRRRSRDDQQISSSRCSSRLCGSSKA
ncbi:MAG: hypothetical protein MZU97_00565 [Bacillus subtilis]|nr:hypothetical protein [Bacillus subtilis]